ncbi:hypothetical protein [Luteolibacter luteus]|uniref:Uncharacterized protein n=1 Tax=Luteolibacter luteus TaxID=2728835 RepID=A0A858RER3_9BACT|nr:hypothetical protein [Luteolibacter luteus]QJE95232.1 hypothetical protein HHL09_05400 [Luteolibacter luteus]
MKRYAEALSEIVGAVNLDKRIESLQLFGAAEAIARTLDEILESNKTQTGYAREKLGLFRSYFLNAVAPGPETDHTPPRQWLLEAGKNLGILRAALN